MPLVLRIYGDSLGLPRPAEGISGADIYTERFREMLARTGHETTIFNRSVGGISLRNLSESWERDTPYFAGARELLVIQCGVVDCAPRPISPLMRAAVSRMPGPVRERVIGFLHRNRAAILKRGFRWRVTKPRVFERLYGSWLKRAVSPLTHILAVNIAPTTPATEEHSPGFSESIALYNAIIAGVVRRTPGNVSLIDVHSALSADLPSFVTADGHHITRDGHRVYAQLLSESARSVLEGSKLAGAQKGAGYE